MMKASAHQPARSRECPTSRRRPDRRAAAGSGGACPSGLVDEADDDHRGQREDEEVGGEGEVAAGLADAPQVAVQAGAARRRR